MSSPDEQHPALHQITEFRLSPLLAHAAARFVIGQAAAASRLFQGIVSGLGQQVTTRVTLLYLYGRALSVFGQGGNNACTAWDCPACSIAGTTEV